MSSAKPSGIAYYFTQRARLSCRLPISVFDAGTFVTLTACLRSAIVNITMGIYLARTFQRRADGSKRVYYILRLNYWDFDQKRQRARYLAYLGREPVLTEEKAKALAKKLGVTIDDLRLVRGLRIKKK